MLPAVIALVVGHGVVMQYVSSHAALSTGIVCGVITLAAIKHLGLLGRVYALARRYFRHTGQ